MSHFVKAHEVFGIELVTPKFVRAQLDKSFDAFAEVVIVALKQRSKIITSASVEK
jgi:hypothetical protein